VNYTGSAIGSPITVYRTKLSVTGSANLTTSRSPIAGPDDIALVNFSADNAHQAQLNGIRFTFSGSAIAGTSPFSVDLIDVNTGVSLGSVSAQTCTVNGNSCSVVFNPNYVISAGTTKTVKIRVNSGNFVTNNGSGTTLSVIVNATNDMNWSDGANTSIGIEPILVPIQIATVQYH
jgi:hypothetical protein